MNREDKARLAADIANEIEILITEFCERQEEQLGHQEITVREVYGLMSHTVFIVLLSGLQRSGNLERTYLVEALKTFINLFSDNLYAVSASDDRRFQKLLDIYTDSKDDIMDSPYGVK